MDQKLTNSRSQVDIKQAVKNNQSIKVSLSEDLLIKDTLVFPHTYNKKITIDGNGFSIKTQDSTRPVFIFKNSSEVNILNTNLSNQIILDNSRCALNLYNTRFRDSGKSCDWYTPFIHQMKGILKCYGCYFESSKKNIVLLSQRSLKGCHAIIGCHAKSTYNMETNFVSVRGYNNEVCVISVYYETVAGTRNNLVYTEGTNRGTTWILGCVMESTVGNIIHSSSPNSNSVVYGSFKNAGVTSINGLSRNKISFDIYDNIFGIYKRCLTKEENNGIIMHNEPTHNEVSVTPTIKHPETIVNIIGHIDLKTKATRYFSLATQENIDEEGIGETVMVFDQCSLKRLRQAETKYIFLNSYLEKYYNTNNAFLFVNPYDSDERKTRIRFASRKKGTW